MYWAPAEAKLNIYFRQRIHALVALHVGFHGTGSLIVGRVAFSAGF